jgi:hypothetical protein
VFSIVDTYAYLFSNLSLPILGGGEASFLLMLLLVGGPNVGLSRTYQPVSNHSSAVMVRSGIPPVSFFISLVPQPLMLHKRASAHAHTRTHTQASELPSCYAAGRCPPARTTPMPLPQRIN